MPDEKELRKQLDAAMETVGTLQRKLDDEIQAHADTKAAHAGELAERQEAHETDKRLLQKQFDERHTAAMEELKREHDRRLNMALSEAPEARELRRRHRAEQAELAAKQEREREALTSKV
jgi:hypothetical protein